MCEQVSSDSSQVLQ